MDTDYHIKSYCHIKSNKIILNGEVIYQAESSTFSEFIKKSYNHQDVNYPKFFKMDNLSKLGFLAAEVLLQNEKINLEDTNNIAIVFSNKSSSLDTDRKHQEAIKDKENYHPSPAVFVYTLPNICVGEISIKYKLYSENSFFIFDTFSASHLVTYAHSLLTTNKAEQVLCGWVDYDNKDQYEAFIYLVAKEGTIKHSEQDVITLYNT
jgi:3-oxoacyl-(acyl-carrier-protein) synthase